MSDDRGESVGEDGQGAGRRRRSPPVTPSESIAGNALEGAGRGPFAGLRRRIYLTYHYLGWRTLLFRLLTFPLRFTPLKRHLQLRSRWGHDAYRRALAWYRERGQPVDIVIPSFRDAERVRALVDSIAHTVPRGMARVIVADDCSGPEHLAGAASDRGHRDRRGNREHGLRRERESRPARRRSRAGRGRPELRRRGAPRLAGVPAVRGLARSRTLASSARGCSTPTGASSSPARRATSGRRSGSTTATVSSRAIGAPRRCPAPSWPSREPACTSSAS